MPKFKFPTDLTDVRSLVVISMVLMTIYILHLIAVNPELAENKLFEDVVKNLTGVGGFGLILMFLFGGSKASNQAIDTVNEIAKNNPNSQLPTQTDNMNVSADTVSVEEKKP